MHEAFRPYLTDLRTRLSEGVEPSEVEDAVCEVAAHLELSYEEAIRRGLSHGQACELALRSLGSSARDLATELRETDAPRIGLVNASTATIVFAWTTAALYALSFAFLPGSSSYLGLFFYPLSSLPMLAFALLMVSSFASSRLRLVGVALAPICCFGPIIALRLILQATLDFHLPYLVNLSVLFVLGHAFTVFLGKNSRSRKARRLRA